MPPVRGVGRVGGFCFFFIFIPSGLAAWGLALAGSMGSADSELAVHSALASAAHVFEIARPGKIS